MLGEKIEDYGVGGSILQEMQNDDVHKNVRIKTTDGSIVQAHSIVLAAVSPKFKAVFEERTFGIYNLSTATVSATTWNMLLDFVYTGCLQLPNSREEVDVIVSAAETLDFVPLLAHLKSFSFETEDENAMRLENVCDICNVDFPTQSALKSHRGHHKRHGYNDYRCDLCLINCRNQKTLVRHKRMHHNQMKEEAAEFEETESVRSFKKVEQEPTDFQCDLCGNYSESLKSLAAHKGHHSRNKLPVPVPLIITPQEAAADAKEYPCNKCDRIFFSTNSLSAHKKIHVQKEFRIPSRSSMSPVREGDLSCEICNMKFLNSKSLHAHRGHHARKENFAGLNQAKPSKNMNGIYSCHKCEQSFHTPKSLQTHISHHRRTCPSCPECGKTYLNTILLQRHMTQQHNSTLTSFSEKKLKTVKSRKIVKSKLGLLQKNRIKRLIKSKTVVGVVPLSNPVGLYKCPICIHKFKEPSHLRAHLQQKHLHQKNWRDLAKTKGIKNSHLPPFWGDYMDRDCKDCNGEMFETATRLAEHRRDVHQDAQPFVCNRCSAIQYSSRVGLRSHIFREHNPQWCLFHCSHCSNVTDILTKAKNHHNVKHKGKEMSLNLKSAIEHESRKGGKKGKGEGAEGEEAAKEDEVDEAMVNGDQEDEIKGEENGDIEHNESMEDPAAE